ncbi:flavodoxin reductase [Devosia sp. Root685]|uniref:flavodoxin reductase n=1 Tax=Devosia sp. Root685 TaxID=1736587 RepID=UPI0006F5288D|nr:flavodoxin reductase [Devosia sp. Root685]KRA96475.1 flavodoxin reductase [Devosia sp. Root685]
MQISVKILDTVPVTHNVRHYRVERPKGYTFSPGQATEVSIDRIGWQDKTRPFTFTCLPQAENLEFTIKSYFDHTGVTNELWSLGAGDRLILRDVWGTIQYRGPGTFIAGGAGVTPFIAILRHLNATGKIAGNRLIVSNQTEKDIILRDEFEAMNGLETLWTVTNDAKSKLVQERIDADFLKRHIPDFSQNFYLCGPDAMVKDLRGFLGDLGATVANVTWEK